ncbi:MAG: DUF4390 domain-containing protein [Gammaproteobacteria bacterium]
MPSWVKSLSLWLALFLTFCPELGLADDFAAKILHAGLSREGASLYIQADIAYQLSPSAKEALHKGVPLTWRVLTEIRRVDKLWDNAIYHQDLPYRLQYHALLNQYEVITPSGQSEMFLTLSAALEYLSSLHDTPPIPDDLSLFEAGRHYKLAIKCLFDRESLPVPLRPFAYLDNQWYLSSDWYIWPIQK